MNLPTDIPQIQGSPTPSAFTQAGGGGPTPPPSGSIYTIAGANIYTIAGDYLTVIPGEIP